MFCFPGEAKAKQDPMYYIRKTNTETDSILSELHRTYKEPVSDWNDSSYTQKAKSVTEECSINIQTQAAVMITYIII